MTTYHFFFLFLGVSMTPRGVGGFTFALCWTDLALWREGLDGGVFRDGTKGGCWVDGQGRSCSDVVLALAAMDDAVDIFTEFAWQFASGTTGRASFKSEMLMVVSLYVVERQVYITLQLYSGVPFAVHGRR
jgi:hypothetical protein